MDNKREWEQCLQVKDVILPTGYFFGASATTGDLSDAHDIISMKLFELEAPEGASNEDRSKLAPKSSFFEPPRGKTELHLRVTCLDSFSHLASPYDG